MFCKIKKVVLAVIMFCLPWHSAQAASSDALTINDLREQLQQKQASIDELNREFSTLAKKVDLISAFDSPSPDRQGNEAQLEGLGSKFSFGGYGEIHANIAEGKDDSGNSNDLLDIHRFVPYIGYEFSDWIQLHSEIELEHALVSDEGGGVVEIEQLLVDFLLSDPLNIRIGRVLIPLGNINQRHEPPTFNGVERPNFAKYIIPSTWWSDGIGIFGNMGDAMSYEAYVVGGVDGSQFSDKNGIRSGRLKERPSLNNLAAVARVDYFPFMNIDSLISPNSRISLSFYYGGFNNGNKGKDPGVNGDLTIYSADFSTRIKRMDVKGSIAFEKIDNAEMLSGGVAEEIFGYYLEAGYHVLPNSWKTGKMKKTDVVLFVRYDDYDTQYKMPAGSAENPEGDRQDWTFGISYYPVHNLVLKADYQVRKDAVPMSDPADFFNLGLGWQF